MSSECCSPDNLRRVLKSGNCTCGNNIIISDGDKIVSENLLLEGRKSVVISSPILSTLVDELTGTVTKIIRLSAPSIEHTTSNFSVIGDTSTMTVNKGIVVGKTEGILASTNLYLNSIPPDIVIDLPRPWTATMGGDDLNIDTTNVSFSGIVTFNGSNLILSPNLTIQGVQKLTLKSPTTVVEGDLEVTGKIINPVSGSAEFIYLTQPDVHGGCVESHSYWSNFIIWTEVKLYGCESSILSYQADGGILFEEKGFYYIDGFCTFHSDDPKAKFLSRFSNLSGIVTMGGFKLGTPVSGSGISHLKGTIEIIDTSSPWYYQYKSSVNEPYGLGLASGLDCNLYASLNIARMF